MKLQTKSRHTHVPMASRELTTVECAKNLQIEKGLPSQKHTRRSSKNLDIDTFVYVLSSRIAMKDFIVLIAILVLGILIAGIVLGFKDNMTTIGTNSETELGSIASSLNSN